MKFSAPRFGITKRSNVVRESRDVKLAIGERGVTVSGRVFVER